MTEADVGPLAERGIRVTMGSREAFEEFVAARRSQLLRAAWLITGDRELAEDLLQEALIKLARAWPRVRTDPAAYVRTILYRDAVSWWRRRRTHTMGQTDPRVVDATEQVVLRVTFTSALARLTVRQRAVLVLRYLEDLSVAETAQVLGVSTGTVKSQTSAALERLRRVAPELRGLTEEADS